MNLLIYLLICIDYVIMHMQSVASQYECALSIQYKAINVCIVKLMRAYRWAKFGWNLCSS